MIVLIDDERDFKQQFQQDDIVVLRNSESAINWFKNMPKDAKIDQVWFDHDLGIVDNHPDTTIPVSRFLEEMFLNGKNLNIRQFVIHTSNPVGGKQLYTTMSKIASTVRVYAGDYLEVR